MNAWNRSAARPHDRRQIQACRAHIAPNRPVRRVLHALFSGASASCTARPAQTMSESSSPSHAAQANCSAAALSAFARPAQTMSKPSSPSHAAQVNRSAAAPSAFSRQARRASRAQTMSEPSSPSRAVPANRSAAAPSAFARQARRASRAQTMSEPSSPLSCRAGELLCRRLPAHHPAAPSNSALCAEMCIAMARASAGRSACRRRQSAPSMKRVCSARCRRWSS